MTSNSKRIIFFAEAVTLAHVARCVAIADALYQTGRYSIVLAVDNRYDRLLGELPYQKIPLYSVSSEFFASQLKKGSPLYNTKTLISYVEEDLKIIDTYKPDFIFGDFRLSLSISSEIRKIPYATITNAYWSPYAKIDYPVPDILITKILGVHISQKLFDLVRPLVFLIHSLPLNNARRKYGLKPLAYDMRECYTHADFTLYADDESLISVASLPQNHMFIGPILWSVRLPLPSWWNSVPKGKPIVFVTLGSSGDNSLLPMILSALSKMPVTTICATAQKQSFEKTYPNIYTSEFLPAKEAVKISDIVICNGGSPMVYQALNENKMIIGIPNNLDQYLMMTIVESSKKGVCLRSGNVNEYNLQEAIEQALQSNKTEAGKKSALSLNLIDSIISKC